MKKIGITTDCVCDLPDEFLKLNDVGITRFYVYTSTGRFMDGHEITSDNIIEYLEETGEKAITSAPDPREYKDFFEKYLKKYDEIIHIPISKKLDSSCINVFESLNIMGKNSDKVHIVDSESLSTGMGHLVVKAVEMRDAGKSAEDIVKALEEMKPKVSTTFITVSLDNLYHNGRVPKSAKNFCSALSLHPILTMKNGLITLKGVEIGNYDKAVMNYLKKELKHPNKINKKRAFITYAGCSIKKINEVKAEVQRLCDFEEVIVTKASATVSGNCGPHTVGLIFVYN